MEQTIERPSDRREVSSAKLAWLYEVEQMDHQRPARRNGAVEQALDRLLA